MMQKGFTIGDKLITVLYKTNRFVDEILEGKEYSYLFNDLVVIDAGCNIGTFTLSIIDKIKQAYCLDISQDCIETLNQTISLNQLANIKTYHLGLAANTSKRDILYKDTRPEAGGWTITPDGNDIDVTDIQTFMRRENINYVDVLKIDIEGAESEVFASPGFKQVSPRINTIIGEHHGANPRELLEQAGYVYFDKNNLNQNHFLARRCK